MLFEARDVRVCVVYCQSVFVECSGGFKVVSVRMIRSVGCCLDQIFFNFMTSLFNLDMIWKCERLDINDIDRQTR